MRKQIYKCLPSLFKNTQVKDSDFIFSKIKITNETAKDKPMIVKNVSYLVNTWEIYRCFILEQMLPRCYQNCWQPTVVFPSSYRGRHKLTDSILKN